MRPDASKAMEAALRTLAEMAETEPDVQEQSRLRSVMTMLALLRAEWDVAVERRLGAAEGYREVVRRGLAVLGLEAGPALRAVEPALERPAPLRLSALEAHLDELRGAVIELQTWLESTAGSEHRELAADVWRAEYADVCSEDRYVPFW